VHLRGEVLEDIDLAQIARRANNYSGSDLKNLAVSAALESLKDVLSETWTIQKKLSSEGPSVTDSNEGKDGAHRVGMQDSEEEDAINLPPRVIRSAHFDAAFEQVTATCSQDMASVQELRRWTAKFSPGSSTPSSSRDSSAPPYLGNGSAPSYWRDSSTPSYLGDSSTSSYPRDSSTPSYLRAPNSATTPATYDHVRPGERRSVNPMGSTPVVANSPNRGMLNVDNLPYSSVQQAKWNT
jgi:hypothetical protein